MIDTTIPLSVRPFQAPNPLEVMAGVEQVRALQGRRQAQDQAQQEEQGLRQLFSGETPPAPSEVIRLVGPERGLKIVQSLSALQGDPRGDFEATQKLLRDVALGLEAMPEGVRAETYPVIRASLLQKGVITAEDVPEQYDPNWVTRTTAYGQTPKAPPTLIQRDPTKPLVNPQTGEEVSPGTPATPKPPSNLDAAILEAERRGDQAAVERYMQLKERVAKAGRAPTQQDYEWVTRGGQAVQIRKGSAQSGDRPYSPPKSTSETAQDRQRKGRLESARGFLTRLNELRDTINTKMGPAAGVTGMLRQGMANIGSDPDVAEYERVRAAGGRALAVAIMGAQNLSDADAAAWSNMLPGARIDKVTAKRLTDQIGKMLEDTDTAPTARPTVTLGKTKVGRFEIEVSE